MSPLPNPAPVRHAILRTLFSPTGLLLCFVVLVIFTCPGARGEDAMRLLTMNDVRQSSVIDLNGLDVDVSPARPERFGRETTSAARSPTPSERSLRGGSTVAAKPAFLARSPLPLIADPMLEKAAGVPAGTIKPMTGPAVGVLPSPPPRGR